MTSASVSGSVRRVGDSLVRSLLLLSAGAGAAAPAQLTGAHHTADTGSMVTTGSPGPLEL